MHTASPHPNSVRRTRWIFVAAFALCATQATAQSCPAPIPISGPLTTPILFHSTTCYGSSPQLLCGVKYYFAPAAAYTLTISTPLVGTISVLPQPNFDIIVTLQSGSCLANGNCVRVQNNYQAGIAETIDLAGIAPGNYSLIVVGTLDDTCGTLWVNVNASADPIYVFASGFE